MENQKVQFVTVGDTLTLSCGRIAAMTSAGLRVTEEPVPTDFFKENRLKDLWGIPATNEQWGDWISRKIWWEKYQTLPAEE